MIFKYVLKRFSRRNKTTKRIEMFCTSDNQIPECMKLEFKRYKALGYAIVLLPTLSSEKLNTLNARYSFMNQQLKQLKNNSNE